MILMFIVAGVFSGYNFNRTALLCLGIGAWLALRH